MNIESEITKTLQHHLRYVLKGNIFNYNDLEDLKDDIMHTVSLYNSMSKLTQEEQEEALKRIGL